MVEKLLARIEGIVRGALKQAAVEMINANVNGLITAGSMKASLLISDWNDYLFIGPQKQAGVFMNDFFTISARGRISTSNYKSCGATAASTGSAATRGLAGRDQNYFKYLTDRAKANINISLEFPEITLPSFSCDSFDLFANGSWSGFYKYSSETANHPTGYSLIAQNAYMREVQKQTELAIRQQSGGMKAVMKDGYVTTPGEMVSKMKTDALDVGNKILADAKDIPEVITAVATKIATQSIQQGIGKAQQNVQREIDKKTQLNVGASMGPFKYKPSGPPSQQDYNKTLKANEPPY